MLKKLVRLTGRFLFAAIWIVYCISNTHADDKEMQQQYQARQPELQNNAFGIPVTIQSSDQNQLMLGVVYGVMDQPFAAVRQALISPQAWCEIVPQHLNIKACTDERVDNYCQLTFYSGRKFYENPKDAYRLPYRFEVDNANTDYFQTTLTANKGPMGTSDYRIVVEAIPIDDHKTFLHFRYAYHYNFLTSLGMETYLATLGSNKVGFSITGTDADGKPVYVDGIRGVIERNTIRYYFAIQSYLETLKVAPDNRLSARLNNWYALTERFPRQLHELDKADYLQYKQHEQADQLQLQAQIPHPCSPSAPQP